eukprot:3757619-Rhodomonas_salina.1
MIVETDTKRPGVEALDPNLHASALASTKCCPTTVTTPADPTAPDVGSSECTDGSGAYRNIKTLLEKSTPLFETDTSTRPPVWRGAMQTSTVVETKVV